MNRKVILVGYMASGKSEIGKHLSFSCKLPFWDLDNIIESELNKSISEIFLTNGELFFRKKEHEVLEKQLLKKTDFILSLGGGTPCYYNNHLFLKNDDFVSIYLKASVNTVFDRVVNQRSNRPLLKNLSEEELKEYIAKHVFERSFYYNQCQYIVEVDNKSVAEIVSEIEKILT
jgi:shikimate kinase